MWLVLHLIVFFIPSSFFLGFGWVALVASIFFLLVQIVIFIEWIYEWNEAWIMLVCPPFFCRSGGRRVRRGAGWDGRKRKEHEAE